MAAHDLPRSEVDPLRKSPDYASAASQAIHLHLDSDNIHGSENSSTATNLLITISHNFKIKLQYLPSRFSPGVRS